MSRRISIGTFRDLFSGDDEFAVIDPRSEREFASGHLLAASNLSLESLAARIGAAVPRSGTLCVLCDTGGGEADAAHAVMAGLGYRNCVVLESGLRAWGASGGFLFTGVSVPGKAFGEFIAVNCRPPSIDAAALQRKRLQDAPLLVVDARRADEHRRYCIPGARLCPGSKLIYRALPVISPRTGVVVHCGGRTRGILGAQTLIDAGCGNVAVLANGATGWQAEGLALETGNRDAMPPPDPVSTTLIRAVSDRLSQDWHIERLDSIAIVDQRNRYLIDVRSRAEYEHGRLAAAHGMAPSVRAYRRGRSRTAHIRTRRWARTGRGGGSPAARRFRSASNAVRRTGLSRPGARALPQTPRRTRRALHAVMSRPLLHRCGPYRGLRR